jgi:hypothetical protein
MRPCFPLTASMAKLSRIMPSRRTVHSEGPLTSPTPAPEGSGVLVRMNTSESLNTFIFYQKAGKVSSLDIGPNAEFVTWLPGTTTALMETGVGYDLRWHLIDWKTGKQLWDIADPSPARLPGTERPVAAAGNYFLIAGLEYIQGGTQRGSRRSIYAVDVNQGRVVAHWLPSPPNQASSDCGRLLRFKEKLFLVAEEEFAEIDLDDIAAKKNGWQ